MKRILASSFVAAIVACSSSSSSPTDATPTGGGGDDGGADAGGDARIVACNLQPIDSATTITPTFAIYDPPTSQPRAMTGGTPNGRLVVTAAKFYLPTNTKSIAHPDMSTGELLAWSVFDGKAYRIFLHAAATIDTSIGPQPQNNDVASQGAFTVSGSTLSIDYSCDAAPPDPLPEYTFSDDGGPKAYLVIKSSTSFGDGYLELEATRL
ncbi:MAG TPA: hypothetical protein VIF62_25960 [Labilithrix sp.]|jgi:hypothetical protein